MNHSKECKEKHTNNPYNITKSTEMDLLIGDPKWPDINYFKLMEIYILGTYVPLILNPDLCVIDIKF